MAYVTIPQNTDWEYDNNPSDPGGALTTLWQTGTNGIRTAPGSQEIYTNVRHKTLHAGSASVPSEMSKSFWAAQGTVLPAKPQTNYSASGLQLTWDANNRGVSIIKSGVPSANLATRLFHSSDGIAINGGTYGAGNYKVSFDVTQNSGINIDNTQQNPHSPTDTALFLTFRDDDNNADTPSGANKEVLAITRGFNSFDIELFDDGDPQKPAITLMIHKAAPNFNVDISNIQIVFLT